MKKMMYLAFALCLGFTTMACSGGKTQGGDAAEATEASASENNEDAEAAVKAYEEYFVKYDELMKRSEAGEDILDELLKLQETSGTISEQLIKTEGMRNDDQKARVKAVEEKINAWKNKI